MKSHRSGFLAVFGAAAILAGVLLMAPAARAETVSPNSWIYEALKSFELRGLVALEPTLPYTFDQCEAYTREIIGERRDARRRARAAARVSARTPHEAVRRNARSARGSMEQAGLYGAARRSGSPPSIVSVGGSVRRNPDQKKGEANGLAVPGILVGFGHNVTMETSYRLRMAPERGDNVPGAKPSARLRSYRGVTAEYERAADRRGRRLVGGARGPGVHALGKQPARGPYSLAGPRDLSITWARGSSSGDSRSAPSRRSSARNRAGVSRGTASRWRCRGASSSA